MNDNRVARARLRVFAPLATLLRLCARIKKRVLHIVDRRVKRILRSEKTSTSGVINNEKKKNAFCIIAHHGGISGA